MSLKSCLILSAGLGTRMGEIGKQVPKVLWPLFEQNLLYTQVQYAKYLGIKSIYINTHYLSDDIRTYISNLNENVIVLHEPELLGSGGAIHNCYNHIVDKNENLLLLNGDQFYFIDKSQLYKANLEINDSHALLFALKVKSGTGYNEVISKNDKLIKIIKHEDRGNDSDYNTYSGMGIINLSNLNYAEGKTGFFDTVANFNKDNILFHEIDNNEYWDFGTTQRYYESSFELIRNKSSKFRKFLINNEIIDLSKIGPDSYNSKVNHHINLTNFSDLEEHSIYFGRDQSKFKGKGVYCGDLFNSLL